MRAPKAAVAVFGALLAGPATAATTPTAAGLAASLRHDGAAATYARLLSTDTWDYVGERMGEGRSDWIALAPQLAPVADGAAAEDLGLGLAKSLPKNPVAVLGAIDPRNGPVIGVDRVCSIGFIEDTVKDLRAYKRSALRAVSSVRTVSLRKPRDACLRVLKRS